MPLWRAPGWHPDDPLPPAQSESRCLTAVGITICSLLHYRTASRCEWRTDTGRLDSSSLDDSSGSTCCLDLSARCNVFLALCLALILTASTSSTGIHSSFSADSMRSRSSSSRYSNCRSSASRINSMPSANHSVIHRYHRSSHSKCNLCAARGRAPGWGNDSGSDASVQPPIPLHQCSLRSPRTKCPALPSTGRFSRRSR